MSYGSLLIVVDGALVAVAVCVVAARFMGHREDRRWRRLSSGIGHQGAVDV
jgi:hypothetical protein